MTPFWAWAIRCQCCADRDRERVAEHVHVLVEYPGAVTPLCRHCAAGQEDARVAE